MQEKDVISTEYFEEPERFADLVNGYVFGGAQVVKPENIRELNRVITKPRTDGSQPGKNLMNRSEKGLRKQAGKTLDNQSGSGYVIRDVMCEVDIGVRVVLISLEAQSDIHYAMPVRVMDADAAAYRRQWRKKSQKHRKKKDLQGAEFLSGFAKEDKLIPTLTLVLYFGSEPWDGPRRLKDMMDLSGIPDDLKNRIADYPMELLEVRKFSNPEKFQTDIQYVFGFLKYAEDKQRLAEYVEENQDVFSELDEQAFDMISCMSRSEELKTIKIKYQEEKGGHVNMCQAITEMIADGEKRGYKRGEEKGYKRGEEKGYKRGEERFMRLTKHLLDEGKTEILHRAFEDRNYRNQLYAKYRIK